MTPMLEKAARAVSERAGYTEYGPVIPEALIPDLVRAVLLAIREPDARVIEAGCDGANEFARGPDEYSTPAMVCYAHTAMIDAILSGEGESQPPDGGMG